MATRIYTASGATNISPTVSSAWEASGITRAPGTTATASYSQLAPTAQPGSGVANDDTAMMQIIYGPIAAATITGTVKGQFIAREVSGSTDARAQVIIRLMAPDGSTVRGTMLAMDTAALANEFLISSTATVENRKFPRDGTQTLTSQTAQDGDYIVIEVGFRNHNTNTSNVRIHSGEPTATTDLPENETQGADSSSGSTYRGWIEFSQTIALPTTNASAGVATATGTAYGPTISFVAPPRSVSINGTDYAGDTMYADFSLTECANRGEVGTGGFDVLDSVSAFDIPAMKELRFVEPAATGNERMFTGFTHERTTTALKGTAARTWAVETVDLNALLSDYVLTAAESADRPAETDYARVVWLLTTALNTVGGVASGVVPNSNTVTMEATDYRGRKAADVLAECSEAAQKLGFIYDYGAGRKLYYDVATGTSLSSTAKISDLAGDPNGTTVFAVQDVTVKKSPDRIFSKVHLTYNGGTVTVSNGTTAATYRQREAAVLDSSITNVTLATVKANALLAGAAAELVEVEGLEVVMAAAYVNDIRAGQRVQIKLTRHGIAAYTYYRVVSKTVAPMENKTHYQVTLGLASDVLASANGSRGSDDIWPQKSNANDDGATVIVDRGGITVTDGAITVTNGSAIVIIDGTSDMFKIAAEGTISKTQTTGAYGTNTTTLSGLGALAASPAAIFHLAFTAVATDSQYLGYANGSVIVDAYHAATSGGSPNQRFISTTSTFLGICYLDGSSFANVVIQVANVTGSNATRNMKYFVLQETVF